ncbi:MAG TPA: DUF4190 domain-containing protein [Acidimicrobiales bacterium]|nr:DUF4190 domain-containing protein [Acidimicrobiales bacterium]
MSGTSNPPAGWFPAPDRPGAERYWDGIVWTDTYRPGGTGIAPPPPQMGSGWQPAPYGSAGPVGTNGFAIASLVLSLIWIYGIGSILALVFGYKARREIDESNGRQTGRGMATAGIVIGWLGVVGATLIIVLIVFVASTDPISDGGINSDPSDGICNPDRFLQDPDC